MCELKTQSLRGAELRSQATMEVSVNLRMWGLCRVKPEVFEEARLHIAGLPETGGEERQHLG